MRAHKSLLIQANVAGLDTARQRDERVRPRGRCRPPHPHFKRAGLHGRLARGCGEPGVVVGHAAADQEAPHGATAQEVSSVARGQAQPECVVRGDVAHALAHHGCRAGAELPSELVWRARSPRLVPKGCSCWNRYKLLLYRSLGSFPRAAPRRAAPRLNLRLTAGTERRYQGQRALQRCHAQAHAITVDGQLNG